MKIYSDQAHLNLPTRQFATFTIDGKLYGIDVMKVQEVTTPLQVTEMKTAPVFIKGLINLRGQIATAIGLRELFGFGIEESTEKMTVICKVDDLLMSFLVDSIGDVIEVRENQFESTPRTISTNVSSFMKGIYKTDHAILSIIDLDLIVRELEKKCA